MNERIKELIEQAGFEEKDGHISIQGVYMFNTTRMEKFAELIVKQCGYYADIFESLGCPGDMDPAETGPSDFIKKQFGIEDV